MEAEDDQKQQQIGGAVEDEPRPLRSTLNLFDEWRERELEWIEICRETGNVGCLPTSYEVDIYTNQYPECGGMYEDSTEDSDG